MASTTHWAPKTSASSESSSGRATAAEFTETLSAPASSTAWASSTRPHAAADRERDEHVVGAAAGQLRHGVALLVRGGDVEEDDLVGALVLVADRELHRVAGVADVHELHALDDAALVHVEAGDHASQQHQASASWRLADAEAALVERLAGDHAGEVQQAQSSSARAGPRSSRCRRSRGSGPAPPRRRASPRRDPAPRASRRGPRSCRRSGWRPALHAADGVLAAHLGLARPARRPRRGRRARRLPRGCAR